MRTTLYILLTSILFITGCNEKTDFTLKGKINNLPSDTLLLLYEVPEFKLDTLICSNGAFEYSFTPDTLTVFSILFNEQEKLPIYAEKGKTVELKGDIDNINIKGEGDNQLMNEIRLLLKDLPYDLAKHKADSIIRSNTYSFTNLYLIEKFFANDSVPDYILLNDLIQKQSGIIKDTPYLIRLLSKINNEKNIGSTQYIQTFHTQDRTGKKFDWKKTRDKLILVDFWASWHAESVAEQDSLENIIKALKNEKFLILSVSLDIEKEAWIKASNRDTTQWIQVCDFKGWDNSVIISQQINKIPSNLLLDKNKRIIAKDIRGEKLIETVKERIQKDKKLKEERKKRRKR